MNYDQSNWENTPYNVLGVWHTTIVLLIWRVQGWKISFSGTRKSVLPRTSSGERCAPRNFELLVTLGGTRVRHIVNLALYQMK